MHAPRHVVRAVSGVHYRLGLNPRLPVSLQRRISGAGAPVLRPPAGTHVEHVLVGGRPAERLTVGASERPRAVLYLHGGGYIIGSARLYRALGAHLARAAGAVAFVLDYRLAPEHVYPAALDDAVAAFRAIVDVHGFAPSQVAIAGDSAGGGLAIAAARALIDAGMRPGALALNSPWVDPSNEDLPVRDLVVSRAWGSSGARMYRGDAAHDDPGYAPIHAAMGDLPPTLVHAADDESLIGQIRRYVALAEAAGGDIELVELPRYWHSAHVLAGTLRPATEAVSDLGLFLRARLR